jgi:nitrous oxidase accessory protein NosD
MNESTRKAAGAGRKLAIMAAVTLAGFVVVPAVASANTAWVSEAPVKAPFSSCASPGFNSIQSAINASVTSVRVCKGTYAEQLHIERALSIVGEAGAKVKLPASPTNSTTPCAVGPEEQDVVAVCGKGTAETVSVSSLTIEGYWPEGTCNGNLYDIFVGGHAKLALNKSVVLGAGANPINGCQGGVGVQVGKDTQSQVGTATLTSDTIEGYQKNGMTVDGKGSTATITKVTVKGAGPAPIAQNGIQISRGALGRIAASTITGNECTVASCGASSFEQLEEDGAGVLFYLQAPGSSVTTSTINENDLGVSHISAAETTKPQVTISSDTFLKDRYAAVMLGQGYATVNRDTMEEGNVGVLLLQYAGQEFGPKGTGSEDKIHKMTKYAVEGLSDLSASDQFGSFTITKSEISGNPTGATVAQSVFTNNPGKLKIILTPSDT